MSTGRWIQRIVVLSALGIASPALGGESGRDEGTRLLDDGRVAIAYEGGSYIGFVAAKPDTGEPVWHGRCAFHFKAGAVFEGICASGRFRRGFLRSADGRSVKFLDTERRDVEAIRSLNENTPL